MLKKTASQQELNALASDFQTYLREQIALLNRQWDIVTSSNQTAPLLVIQNTVHQLHGQGTLFGFPDLSKIAGKLEQLLSDCLQAPNPISKQGLDEIGDCISELEIAAGQSEGMNNLIDAFTITDITTHKEDHAPSEKQSILLIEDTEITRRHIALNLRLAGFDVWEADAGKTGIDIAYSKKPDLILLDIKLPDVDGFAVQQKIKTHDDLVNVPLIFLTALSQVNVSQIQTALSLGVTDYVPKPFDMDRLLQKIKTHLG